VILNDIEISELCNDDNPLIEPFVKEQVRKRVYSNQPELKAISYGLGYYGYDLRLGCDFRIPFSSQSVSVRDKLKFEECKVERGKEFWIPPNSWVLAHTVETLNLPDNVHGLVFGKSTYARIGVLVNATPVESGWCGILTLNIVNTGNSEIGIVAGEGIAQIVFLQGNSPSKTYSGKYQGTLSITENK